MAMSKLHELARLGQSVWFDYLRRSFLISGKLQALIDKGLRGATSNPSAFERAMTGISEKQACLEAGKKGFLAQIRDFQPGVENTLKQIRDNDIVNRIWAHDHTIWKADPQEISNRLGWLHCPEIMMDAVSGITSLVEEVRSAGFRQALLLGMGGSSLAPEMFRYTFGVSKGYLDLAVLDSTDPGAVREYTEKFKPAKTLFIVSTKSGGTVETLSFMKHFYTHVADAEGLEHAGEHFIAITDPGSGLEAMAKELKFRKTFLNDPNIGGRYSALSYFGLVPAALIGMDIAALLESAARMACNCEFRSLAGRHHGQAVKCRAGQTHVDYFTSGFTFWCLARTVDCRKHR